MTSKPSSSRPTASTTTTGVRRNLFHHQLSRRPPKQEGLNAAASKSLQEPQQDDSLDIVGRDRNGNYHVEMPVLPPLDEEQAHEEEGGGGTEKDKLEARLLEMLRDHNIQPGEALVPELLTAVQSSLRRKVVSLDGDDWIFEAERGTPDG